MRAAVLKCPLLVLAGGKATRLGVQAQNLPKYLMPISAQKTFADLHLEWVARQGFRVVGLAIGHLGTEIQSHCGDGSRYGLQIDYFADGPKPLGTAGAIKNSLFSGQAGVFSERAKEAGFICVTYGDTLLDFDVADFVRQFEAANSQAAMAISRNQDPRHINNVAWDGANLIYDKSNPDPLWQHIDHGFLALRCAMVKQFPETGGAMDLAQPLSVASSAGEVSGYLVKSRFWEIGTPEALHEFRAKAEGDP